jgi:serine/threonine protein kinase/WD40 repeat protein
LKVALLPSHFRIACQTLTQSMSAPADREVAVLNAALECPAEERAAFLDRACAGEARFRSRIEALIRAHEEGTRFLEPRPSLGHLALPVRPGVASTEKPGDRIGRYKLLQQIGEGGCGVVYMAEQEEPVRRRAALKVIKLGMDTRQVIARFEAERQAIALMDHPNIARVLDAGATETGRPYFVMELVRGVKITEFCDQSELSTEERLRLFIQVCQAIQHAHQKGIIHRDIKPSNILVTMNDGIPVPKVIDFGIAKAAQGKLTDQTLFTAFEQFIGTPAYMSPEQAVMTNLDVDTRSDIYSLGVLLYELLTGRTPFDQSELLAAGLDGIRRIIREREPMRPSTRLSTLAAEALTATAQHRRIDAPRLIHVIRGDLDWIVMKCLEKDRPRRYESATGVADDIGRYLSDDPIVARPPSKLYEFQKAVRRHRAGFAVALALGLMLVAGVVGLSISNSRIRREREQKEQALETAKRNEQEARLQLFTSLKRQAEARRYSRQVGQRTESLKAVAEAAAIQKDDELRDIAIAAMAVSDFRPGPTWQAFASNQVDLAFDALYRRYAALDREGVITIHSIPDGRELKRFESGPVALPNVLCRGLEFSPDGRLLAKREPGYRWSLWRLSDAKLLFRTPSGSSSSVAFSRDSKRLAVGNNSHLILYAGETGEELNRWPFPELPHSMQFSPDDASLAIGPKVSPSSPNSAVAKIYGVESGQLIRELPTHSTFDVWVSWHPSGKYLAATCNLTVQVWDVEAAAKISEMRRHASQVTAVAFSPDGALAISDSWDGIPGLWSPSPGRELVRCYSGRNFFRFSPDGRWAGVMWNQAGKAQLLEVVPSPEYQTFFASQYDAEYFFHLGDVSPRGNLLALGSANGWSLRELPSGRELAWLPIGHVSTAQFTPDGSAVITCGPVCGLQVWPVTDVDTPRKLRLGPPRRISLPFKPINVSIDRGGNIAAVCGESSGRIAILDLRTDLLHPARFQHEDVCYTALSPDAQWLATGGWHSPELRIWNAETGELVASQMGERFFPTFTPDGRELVVVSESGFAFLSTNTWQPTRETIPAEAGFTSWPAFSRDGNLMAIGTAPGVIQIRDARTSRLLARLEDPNGDVPLWIAFSHEDTHLLSMCSASKAIHRWDLAAIRARLKGVGLDWDWPEFRAARTPGRPVMEVKVVFD